MRTAMLLLTAVALGACGDGTDADTRRDVDAADVAEDSAFAALQERGGAEQGMGVDQYESAHQFDDLPDGGRIELQDTAGNAAAVVRIRAHMQEIAEAFSIGDFSTPGFVHDVDEVPGTRVMADLSDAIHDFLAFQRLDHRAMGHDMHR